MNRILLVVHILFLLPDITNFLAEQNEDLLFLFFCGYAGMRYSCKNRTIKFMFTDNYSLSFTVQLSFYLYQNKRVTVKVGISVVCLWVAVSYSVT